MGMYANYQFLSDEDLRQLKNLDEDEFFEEVEEWNEDAEVLLDIVQENYKVS